ncbi:DUF4011 domain-containing protein [Klebsiella pneumoniae subsp. pneumoniae]|nr:DUF4011 domain-containing protein [Klebsiella pneumoniae subsp. pneumoniae]
MLDIGLRNNMLNFRKTAKTLMVVDEPAEEVFNILYRQDKTMTFRRLSHKKLKELAEQEGGEDEEALLPELENLDYAGVFADAEDEDESGTSRRHLDTRLQTALSDEKLFLQLLKIHTEAKGFIEEQGVNTLFPALASCIGMKQTVQKLLRKAPCCCCP